MKKIIISLFILSSMLCNGNSVFALELTAKQFENLGIIDQTLRAKYPEFKGFNGTRKNMNAIGLKINPTILKQEIDKIDIDSAVENIPANKRRKALRNKLKQQGFTEDDFKTWNLL